VPIIDHGSHIVPVIVGETVFIIQDFVPTAYGKITGIYDAAVTSPSPAAEQSAYSYPVACAWPAEIEGLVHAMDAYGPIVPEIVPKWRGDPEYFRNSPLIYGEIRKKSLISNQHVFRLRQRHSYWTFL